WRVMLVWECALRGKTRLEEEALRTRLEEWLCAGTGNGEIDSRGIRSLS
ncbi:MAG TPA: very short patch repair endonuclease, partial [Erwinia persicina]|nr:very short patch repair endonuclease [Erwinia persicina]